MEQESCSGAEDTGQRGGLKEPRRSGAPEKFFVQPGGLTICSVAGDSSATVRLDQWVARIRGTGDRELLGAHELGAKDIGTERVEQIEVVADVEAKNGKREDFDDEMQGQIVTADEALISAMGAGSGYDGSWWKKWIEPMSEPIALSIT